MYLFGAIQDAVKAVGAGGLIQSLPPNRWDKVSVNGKQTATVTAHGIGLTQGVAWTYFTFQDDTSKAVQTIWAEQTALGHETVSIAPGAHDDQHKGVPQSKPSIRLVPIIEGFEVKISVRLSFTDAAGEEEVYRFDGRSWP